MQAPHATPPGPISQASNRPQKLDNPFVWHLDLRTACNSSLSPGMKVLAPILIGGRLGGSSLKDLGVCNGLSAQHTETAHK